MSIAILEEGTVAPAILAQDQDGNVVSLEEYRGRKVILYFYPKDDTPGCTKEACAFRDNFPNFNKLGVDILGVSIDNESKHKKFAEKFSLPFRLVADPDRLIVEAYGVWGQKMFMGREYMGTSRVTYLINEQGVIEKVWPKVNPALHAEELLDYLQQKTS